MKKIYSEETLLKNKKELKKARIIAFSFLIVFYAVTITLAFFLNDARFRVLVILMIISSSIGGCVFLYFLFAKIIPCRKKIKFFNSLNGKELIPYEGAVECISNEVTIAPYITVREITLTYQNKKNVLYFDVDEAINLRKGLYIRVNTYQYQVIEYEINE